MNNGGPAFPTSALPGMTLRDYFAAKAMRVIFDQKIVDAVTRDAGKKTVDESVQLALAIVCYQFADAMLAAREQKGEGK